MIGLSGPQPRTARGFGVHEVKPNKIFKRDANVNKDCWRLAASAHETISFKIAYKF